MTVNDLRALVARPPEGMSDFNFGNLEVLISTDGNFATPESDFSGHTTFKGGADENGNEIEELKDVTSEFFCLATLPFGDAASEETPVAKKSAKKK